MRQDHSQFPAASYKRAVLEPIYSDFQEHFLESMNAINTAHSIMLHEQGIITLEEAQAILQGLKALEHSLDLSEIPYTGEFEDVFFLLEHELAKAIGTDTAGKLHTGRSRNDMDLTMYKMKLRQEILQVQSQLNSLLLTLIKKAEEEIDTIVVAYTHGQPAQPTTFGHYLGAWIEVLLRDQRRLLETLTDVDLCSMGAAAITTTGFPLNRERMAELLGFSGVQANSYGCIAGSDYLMNVYSTLKILFTNLGRFAQDLSFQTSYEVAQLYVPNSLVQISSIMPQKRNPVPVEHLRLMASKGIGYCDLIMTALHNTPFTDMNDAEDPVQMAGLQAFTELDRILPLLEEFMASVEVETDTARQRINQCFCSITELADSLVRVEGISFRQAHAVTKTLAIRALAEGASADTIPFPWFEEAFREALGRATRLTESDFYRFLTPENFVAVRTCLGGPAKEALSPLLKQYAEDAETLAKQGETYRTRQTHAEEMRNRLLHKFF